MAHIDDMNADQLAALPLDQVAILLEDAAIMAKRAAGYRDRLQAMLDARFAETARAARRAGGKDTGTVRFTEANTVVVADLPKKVAWNPAKLREASAALVEMGENPAEYITTELKVAESKFAAWPESLRAMFVPARTVATGKPTYELLTPAA